MAVGLPPDAAEKAIEKSTGRSAGQALADWSSTAGLGMVPDASGLAANALTEIRRGYEKLEKARVCPQCSKQGAIRSLDKENGVVEFRCGNDHTWALPPRIGLRNVRYGLPKSDDR